jgi:hypothetical protein
MLSKWIVGLLDLPCGSWISGLLDCWIVRLPCGSWIVGPALRQLDFWIVVDCFLHFAFIIYYFRYHQLPEHTPHSTLMLTIDYQQFSLKRFIELSFISNFQGILCCAQLIIGKSFYSFHRFS